MDVKAMILAMAALTVLTTEAFPRRPHAKCRISQYKTLLPSQLRAVQELRDKYEERMLPNIQKCPTKHLQQRPSVHQFTVHERILYVEQKLSLAVHVLKNFSNPELLEYVSKPLHMLITIREDLRHCPRTIAHKSQKPTRLDTWLKEFNKDKEMETQECLEMRVTLNLFQMLNEDLKCTAYMEQCDKLAPRLSLPPQVTTAN
ncbi:interferon lambda-3-like [Ambystoma mexicanum]|uniref:interferon lambda-3-like n=1 Tax=Ambystoma mexicanum TaxID=8296 RepID=UPI0037E878FF